MKIVMIEEITLAKFTSNCANSTKNINNKMAIK